VDDVTVVSLKELGVNVSEYKGKHFLTLLDYTSQQVKELLDLAILLKKYQKEGIAHPFLAGQTLVMIFEKSSTRTRVSFEIGMSQLGGFGLFLSSNDSQLGRGEPISDTAQVLSRYADGIMIRTHGHEIIEELAKHSTVPVINALTEDFHPCQALADLLTIYEVKGSFEGLKTVYVGDGNNVAHSLLIACAKVGIDVAIATPVGYEPKEWIVEEIKTICQETGATFLLTNDPIEAVRDADVIYTDVWTSMGHEEESAKRLAEFNSFQINQALVEHAKSDYIFLHCLPAHREEEVTAEIIDGKHSHVFDQAENRLHAQKAVLVALMGKSE
jgi:ornithine carbamoyltransferase